MTMGLLSLIFTGATVATTWRFFRTLESALNLQYQNENLLYDLQIANTWSDALNHQLELRVQERTAELRDTNANLRAEIAQREQMERELLRVRNLESLGVLAGGIAHDFNNFLTIVQGNIELARLQLTGDDGIQDILEDSRGRMSTGGIPGIAAADILKGWRSHPACGPNRKTNPPTRSPSRAQALRSALQSIFPRISGRLTWMPARLARFSTTSSSTRNRPCRKAESLTYAPRT